jgi:hypothetical protein
VAVPEPSTWIMMLAGFAGLGLAAWTKDRAVKFRCVSLFAALDRLKGPSRRPRGRLRELEARERP